MRRCLRIDSNCIDIGCHQGSFLHEMLRFAPEGHHYAFEPIPNLYQELVKHFPKVEIYDIALSNNKAETSFQFVTSNPGYSGLKRRKYDRSDEVIEQITVKTDLLDSIIPENVPISFIKMDVEGGELGVFQGAVKTIGKNRPLIVFEHGLGAADFYKTTPDQVYDLLTNTCSLHVSLMSDWLADKNPLERQEFRDHFYTQGNYYFLAHP
jgi:FkbM family methyltransferase